MTEHILDLRDVDDEPYAARVQAGTRRLRIIALAWSAPSKAKLIQPDLLCFVTDLDTDQRIRFVLPAANNHRSLDGATDFRLLRSGTLLAAVLVPLGTSAMTCRSARLITTGQSVWLD